MKCWGCSVSNTANERLHRSRYDKKEEEGWNPFAVAVSSNPFKFLNFLLILYTRFAPHTDTNTAPIVNRCAMRKFIYCWILMAEKTRKTYSYKQISAFSICRLAKIETASQKYQKLMRYAAHTFHLYDFHQFSSTHNPNNNAIHSASIAFRTVRHVYALWVQLWRRDTIFVIYF